MRLPALALVGLALVAVPACKRRKPATLSQVWLGPTGGCALVKETGGVTCWGLNEHGESGDGTKASRPLAAPVSFPMGAPTSLALGRHHGCGVFDTHERRAVACWGEGSDNLAPHLLPDTAPPGQLDVAVGGDHTCVRAGRTLRCFGGEDPDGILGPWPSDAEIRAVAVGEAHVCVAYANEHVVCRGEGFGDHLRTLLEGAPVTALVAGGHHTCALLEGGTMRCWGADESGQLGDGRTTSNYASPAEIHELRGVLQIAAGSHHTCALLGNRTVACWGGNGHYQLANGTKKDSAQPAMVLGVLGVVEIAAAGAGTCARLGDGTLRCWGQNDVGQLGDDSREDHNVPAEPRFRP